MGRLIRNRADLERIGMLAKCARWVERWMVLGRTGPCIVAMLKRRNQRDSGAYMPSRGVTIPSSTIQHQHWSYIKLMLFFSEAYLQHMGAIVHKNASWFSVRFGGVSIAYHLPFSIYYYLHHGNIPWEVAIDDGPKISHPGLTSAISYWPRIPLTKARAGWFRSRHL